MIRRSFTKALLGAAAYLVTHGAFAQGNIVIQGGTLIDGTGRAPVENSVIVIEGNRIKAVGRRGDLSIPVGAPIFDIRGKTVLPGFIDGHCHWESFWGEIYLHLGITTCVQIQTQQNGPWSLAQKEGTELGRIRGPRIWSTGQALGSREGEYETEGSRGWRGYIDVPTPEAARAIVQQKKKDGYEGIKVSEFLTPDVLAVITDEAHRLGMGVTGHSRDVVGYSKAGIDGIEHIWSVGYSSILDTGKRNKLAVDRTAGRIDAEEAGAFYEVEGFDTVIKAMVDNQVAFTPTIAKWLRPFSPNAGRFWKREQEILSHPKTNFPAAVRVITEYTTEKLFKRYKPDQLERARVGYQKANEFISRYVAAGGMLKEGSDPPRGMAGLLLHEALVMDVEAGVSPMMAIQAATINVAKVFRKDKDYGTVEPGKVADLAIIDGDPLRDIWMTQNVKMVVLDGQVVNSDFTGYVNPIPEFNAWQQLSPTIEVQPAAIVQGTGPTTLRVAGKGFWPFHQVLLNGKVLETKFVSRSALQAVVPADLVRDVGMYKVTVKSEGETIAESSPAPLVVKFAR